MSSYEAPIELLSPAREPREECLFFPPLQTNQNRLDDSLSQVEKAIQHSKGYYEKLKMEFEDLKKTCTILVANLHTFEKKLETATVENLALKHDARLDELQRENKQLKDERTRHQISQRNCLNEVQRLRKDRSDLHTQLQQVTQRNKLRVVALKLILKRKREQKCALHDEVVALRDATEATAMRDALNNANRCMTRGTAIGVPSDGGIISSIAQPEGSDVTSRLHAEVEGLKAQLKSSTESFATSRRQLAQENVALQTKLGLLTPKGQDELDWMDKLMRLQRFKTTLGDNGAIPDSDQGYWVSNKGAILDADLGFWVIHQRQQLREYEGNKRKRIDLLNSINFHWGDDHPLNKKHGKKLRSD